MRLGLEAALVEVSSSRGHLAVDGGVVTAVGLAGRGRGVAVPGLVDLQVNGYAGVDLLTEPERARRSRTPSEGGVTAWQPTLITSPTEQVLEATRALATAPRSLGTHLEGPFLSPSRPGTHPVEHLREPDLGLLRLLLGAGPVSSVTLAPELPGALELVDELVERNITVSLGHTDATAIEAERAFARGASTVTHLFNAMRPFHHRDPGVVGAALARRDVVVQLIADGAHVADEAVLLACHAAGGRLALVSDAIAAAGVGDGSYRLGGVEVRVEGGVCRRADRTLAGSAASLLDGVRTLVRLGVTLEQAVAAASTVPARVVRREDLGLLRPGARRICRVLDDRLDVLRAPGR